MTGPSRAVNSARAAPNLDSVCFHAQQCAEKYLKACLHDAAVYFDKTHNLVKLLDQLVALEPDWAHLRPELQDLTTHAVEVRYPGVFADRAMAKGAVATCNKVRELVRARLKLEPDSVGRTRKRKVAKSMQRRTKKR
ncbi:HEPN domain protein [Phycisphaerae bacterium RAS1]|nr:HEPN domain protein [Phycisphaerae bacterium RAS1]